MGNKWNKRSRWLETPSPERDTSNTQVETPNTGNGTLTNFNTVVHKSLGDNNPGNQLTEPSQISNEIQTWTQILEQKNNDRIEKMREEMDNKFEAILREKKDQRKCINGYKNPRSEFNEKQDPQSSGSKTKSIGVRASSNENSNSENDDYPLRALKMKDLKYPAKPFFQNESYVDATILSTEESDAEEDYHSSEFKCSWDVNNFAAISMQFNFTMSTRSQKRRIYLQENIENVSDAIVSPIPVKNICLSETAVSHGSGSFQNQVTSYRE